ncbi:MAG TPA: fibronectin type III domain-containing protein [Thermoplasmata archaeon]
MNARSLSRRNRAIGLLVVAFIIMMGAAVIASAGLVVAPPSSMDSNLKVFDSPPAAPTGLAATALSTTEIGLSWTNPSGSVTDNHVYIWVAASCSNSPNEAIDLGGNYTSYAATPLAPSTDYSFEVTASTSGGEGPPSNCATAMTQSLGPPTGLAATALSTTEIGLSWTDPSGTLTDNTIYFWVAASCSGSQGGPPIDLGGVFTTYSFTDLTPSTNYSFEVTASTSGVEGPPSNCVTTITPPPGAPTGLTATVVSAHKIDLSWTNPWGTLTANTVYEYSSSCSTLLNTYVIGVATTYTATGLKSSTTYCFTVSASITGGAGPQSASANATTHPLRPSAPTGLTATAVSDSEIDLAWTNPVGPLTGNYVLGDVNGCNGADPVFAMNIPVATTYDATGLPADATYCFQVYAENSTGYSAAAGPVYAATGSDPPAPTGLTATAVSASEIDLNWTNPSGTLTANAVYEYSSDCSTLLNTYVIGVATTYAATGLTPSTTYCFTVSASTNGGAGPQSASASAMTFRVVIG